ncbi:serine/threonine-protein kinase [Streptomyces sp. NPDC002215]|uniref:serine/threonine-protein kinase n=1 Tax=Streptomyces sp. NPDC002215 TaxID=3154412 RepID=UPI00332F4F1F
MPRLALHSEFRYIHEPLPMDDPAIPVLGHEDLVAGLRRRLTYSHGGTFLITGFRGVGKSTLVIRALTEAAGTRPAGDVLLPVYLNVARRMEANQLLFAVVRRVFETLEDRGLLDQLPEDVQNALILAYMRTSLSFKQTHSEGSERGGTVGMAPQQGLVASLSPTASLTGKLMSTRATEASFLAYSELDVEHDLVRIIQLLDLGHVRRERRGLLRRRRTTRLRIHPVVVLDEVDKLTENSQDALTELEALLGRLKSVLTSRGAHFLLIGGPDLQDSALRDADRGNGLYESVFAWRMYVPCLWEAPERLVRELVRRSRAEDGAGPGSGPVAGDGDEDVPLDTLIPYLRFKSRGVPRRLLQELNALVDWDDHSSRPALVIEDDALRRVAFYSRLDAVIADVVAPTAEGGPGALPLDEDRRRLVGYHVLDWILRSRGRAFTAGDIESQIDPLLHVDIRLVDRLLRHLVHENVITVVSERGRADRTVFGNLAGAGAAYYRLSDEYAAQLPGLARHSESERADLGMPSVLDRTSTVIADDFRRAAPAPPHDIDLRDADTPSSPTAGPPVTRLAGRYEVGRLIGQGGMGAVHRGRDLQTGEEVAVKMLNAALASDEAMRARFHREARIGMRVRHRHVARTVDVVEEPELALVMELVEGPTLGSALEDGGPLSADQTIGIARQIGAALAHLASLGVSRIDLKPNNVILHPRRGAVVVDLGVAHGLENGENGTSITEVGMVIGTPGYMSPEQVEGGRLDIRSDIFTLGLLLWECLMGHSPYDQESVASRLFAILHEDVDPDVLPGSDELRAVIRKCTARSLRDRYQTPEQLLTDLDATPEAQETGSA